MLSPFVYLVVSLLHLYMICIISWTILSTLISFKIVNAYQPFVRKLMPALDKLCEPALRPIRKYIPDLGGFDISPIILIVLINTAQYALRPYL